MKSIILLPLCFALALGEGAPYSFGYTTADGQSRQESGSGGAVQGSYSYTDPNGDLRQVNYIADALGFRASGDISVDRKTAEAATALAALAPKGTAGPLPLALTAPAPGPIQAPYISQYAAPIASYAAPFAQYNTLASPALALKGYAAAPAYNTLAAGPALSSYSTSINHGLSGLSAYSSYASPAIAAPLAIDNTPLIAKAEQLRSYAIKTPTHIGQFKI